MALPVVKPVTALLEAVCLQPARGRNHIERMRLQSRIEPESVRRRNWPYGGHRVAAKRDAGNVGAIDGFGNGAAEALRLKPQFLVRGNGRARSLIEPHH